MAVVALVLGCGNDPDRRRVGSAAGEGPRGPGNGSFVTPFDLPRARTHPRWVISARRSLGFSYDRHVLAVDSVVRPIDVGTVFAAWRTRLFANGASLPRDSAIEMAGSVGAQRVVVGSVIGTRAHAIIQATVLSLPYQRELAKATVEGPADSITALVGQLAARLLVSEAGENERVAIR